MALTLEERKCCYALEGPTLQKFIVQLCSAGSEKVETYETA